MHQRSGFMNCGDIRNHESEDCHQKEFVEMKLRQRMREECVELRELESQLRTAYVNKELHAQLAEKEAEKLAQQYRQGVAEELMRQKWSEEEEAMKDLKKSQVMAKELYRMELHEQEKQEEEKRRAAYQDFLREKILIDEIVQRIHEEDLMEQEEAMLKKKKTKHDMDEFRWCQMKWKEKERLALEEENRRIIQFLRDKEDFECKLQAAAKRREEAKAAVTKALMDVIKEEEGKRREREDVRQSLMEEELRSRAEGEVQLRLREAALRHHEERMAQEWQRQQQMEKLAREAEEEASERQKLLEEMAKSERLEQLNSERRRRKEAEHRRAVEVLLEERRRLREHQMAVLKEEQLSAERQEEARRLAIEHERLKMLQEHATKLVGYLPKGVLREDDLSFLGINAAASKGGGDGKEVGGPSG